MKSKIDAHLGSNITVVLDRLDIATVSRDKIRAALAQVVLMDTPDLVIVMAPAGIVIQIAERRIIVADQTQSEPGKVDIWTPTLAAVSAVTDSKVVAYGFNYDFGVTLEGVNESDVHLTKLLLPTAEALRQALGAETLTASPRMIYHRGPTQYDIRLEPAGGPKLRAHLNVHFADKPLPDPETLRGSFLSEFDEVGRILESL